MRTIENRCMTIILSDDSGYSFRVECTAHRDGGWSAQITIDSTALFTNPEAALQQLVTQATHFTRIYTVDTAEAEMGAHQEGARDSLVSKKGPVSLPTPCQHGSTEEMEPCWRNHLALPMVPKSEPPAGILTEEKRTCRSLSYAAE